MPPRGWQVRVEDMLEALDRIDQRVRGLDFERFEGDPRVVEAVAFNLLVLGEAAAQLPDEVRQSHPELPWSQLRGLRNVIAHEYFDLDVQTLWNTVRNNLPPLVTALRKMLDSGGGR